VSEKKGKVKPEKPYELLGDMVKVKKPAKEEKKE